MSSFNGTPITERWTVMFIEYEKKALQNNNLVPFNLIFVFFLYSVTY